MLFGIGLDGYGHDAANQETSSNDRYQPCVLPSKEPCIVITPTEAFAALDAGAQGLKFFPADLAPPSAVKAMRAVLPADCLLIPVGGISPANMPAYLQAGASGFGMGSNLYTAGKALEAIRQSAIELIAV